MDLYSTLNSLAPRISYLNCDFSTNIHSNEDTNISDFPPTDNPVYILGNKYSSLHELDEIRSDVRSNIWMTYRKNFQPIGDTSFTSDSGWGCMLRCGQMVLARSFINLKLGRDWRWNYENLDQIKQLLTKDNDEELNRYLIYRNILKMFSDEKISPYSIHQIALMGVCEGKNVGQWFGPNTIAQVLRKLSTFDKINNMYIYVAMDNIVFIDDIRNSCLINNNQCQKIQDNLNTTKWKPLILFIPLRLGLTEINPIYFRALKTTFTFPQTLGILGGRPNHALYFIGCCGDDLIYLDPHKTQMNVQFNAQQNREYLQRLIEESQLINVNPNNNDDDVNIENEDQEQITPLHQQLSDDISYHCERPFRMSISSLDPSLSLCFLCKTEEEFNQWLQLTRAKLLTEKQQPLFEIMQTRPSEWHENDLEFNNQTSSLNKINNGINDDQLDQRHSSDDDDFEIL